MTEFTRTVRMLAKPSGHGNSYIDIRFELHGPAAVLVFGIDTAWSPESWVDGRPAERSAPAVSCLDFHVEGDTVTDEDLTYECDVTRSGSCMLHTPARGDQDALMTGFLAGGDNALWPLLEGLYDEKFAL